MAELSKTMSISEGSGRMEFLQLDLSDIKSCVGAAKRFLELEKRLDVIVANAALSVAVRAFSTIQKPGREDFPDEYLRHSHAHFPKMALRYNSL